MKKIIIKNPNPANEGILVFSTNEYIWEGDFLRFVDRNGTNQLWNKSLVLKIEELGE